MQDIDSKMRSTDGGYREEAKACADPPKRMCQTASTTISARKLVDLRKVHNTGEPLDFDCLYPFFYRSCTRKLAMSAFDRGISHVLRSETPCAVVLARYNLTLLR